MLSKYPNVRWSLCAGECYLETNDFIQFSMRDEAQTDHLFMNKPSLYSAPMRTPLSTLIITFFCPSQHFTQRRVAFTAIKPPIKAFGFVTHVLKKHRSLPCIYSEHWLQHFPWCMVWQFVATAGPEMERHFKVCLVVLHYWTIVCKPCARIHLVQSAQFTPNIW